MNQQRITLLVLLDLSAAFDTIGYTFLLDRLHAHFGISGHAHSWIKSYFHHRFQSISFHSRISKRFEAKYGVPQGSCLGPILFVLYASTLFMTMDCLMMSMMMSMHMLMTHSCKSPSMPTLVRSNQQLWRTCKNVLLTSEIGCYLTGLN